MPTTQKLLTAAAGSAGGGALYVEDVFSTYLYDGTATTNNIVNGVDLTGGGLVWFKTRDDVEDHNLVDSERGSNKGLESNTTDAETGSAGFSTFNSNGFTLTGGFGKTNSTSSTYASWSFRKQKGFFDCVKFSTTSGGGQQTVSHNLGSIPGTIILKQITAGGDGYWYVFHKSVTSPNSDWWRNYANLNITAAFGDWGSTAGIYSAPTSSGITVSTYFTNQTADFIAYFFAEGGSDDQIFGDDEDENIIKCGVYTTDGQGNATVNLGFEPQWILSKRTNGTGAWYIRDVMRGMPVDGDNAFLFPNTSGTEADSSFALRPSATGFTAFNDGATKTNIYMAIRRPMKTPESGTEVFASQNPGYPLNSAGEAFTSGFPVDWALSKEISATDDWLSMSRLQGAGQFLETNTADAEASGVTYGTFDHMTGWYSTASANMSWMFKRAAGFMDLVVADAPGYAWTNQPHNLGVVPELLIYKSRAVSGTWYVMSSALASSNYYMGLNNNNAAALSGASQYSATATTVSYPSTPTAGSLVSYLFATLAGVSKVGSYTGTGSSLNVDCGFTAGARFILIKRTDNTGDWYIYDSTRGISASGTNDPYLFINTAAVQVTNTDYIGILNAGFTVTSSAPAALNASGGTYIFLAIA